MLGLPRALWRNVIERPLALHHAGMLLRFWARAPEQIDSAAALNRATAIGIQNEARGLRPRFGLGVLRRCELRLFEAHESQCAFRKILDVSGDRATCNNRCSKIGERS